MGLLVRGNGALGPRVWHTDLPALLSCPGASEWCHLVGNCYAQKGNYMFESVQKKYADNFGLLRFNPDEYEAQLRSELRKVRPDEWFRIHTSGDMFSVAQIELWARVITDHPHIPFWFTTRAWTVEKLRVAIEELLFPIANLRVWGSTDKTLGLPPEGWREARIFDTQDEAREAGYTVCPKQATPKRHDTCSTCGLCWRAKPLFRLAFIQH